MQKRLFKVTIYIVVNNNDCFTLIVDFLVLFVGYLEIQDFVLRVTKVNKIINYSMRIRL